MTWYRITSPQTDMSFVQRLRLAAQILRGWNFTVTMNVYTSDGELIYDSPELVLEKEER